MTIKSGDFVIYECPAFLDEKGALEIELKIVKIKSLVWIHDHQQFIDEEGNFYDDYRVRKIIRDKIHIDSDSYEYGKILADTKKMIESKNKNDQSSSL